MTHITSHGLHACHSFDGMIAFMGLDRLKRRCAVGAYESADGFRTMTHYESYGICYARL